MKNKKDRASDIPLEANRDKDINYFEQQEKAHGEYVKNSKALQKRMRKSASSSG